MNNILDVTLTRTRDLQPLATVDGLPGGSADLTPAQLRALAGGLLRIAADAESRPVKAKTLPTLRREYRLQEVKAA
jgi:hypothetical protein